MVKECDKMVMFLIVTSFELLKMLIALNCMSQRTELTYILLIFSFNMMKFSQAFSQVKWLSSEKTNILKTISVLVLRVLV
jgi:hypothetical protein